MIPRLSILRLNDAFVQFCEKRQAVWKTPFKNPKRTVRSSTFVKQIILSPLTCKQVWQNTSRGQKINFVTLSAAKEIIFFCVHFSLPLYTCTKRMKYHNFSQSYQSYDRTFFRTACQLKKKKGVCFFFSLSKDEENHTPR